MRKVRYAPRRDGILKGKRLPKVIFVIPFLVSQMSHKSESALLALCHIIGPLGHVVDVVELGTCDGPAVVVLGPKIHISLCFGAPCAVSCHSGGTLG